MAVTFTGLSISGITNDLEIVGNSLRLPIDNEAIAQHVKQRLMTYQGEWFLDIFAGVPWFQEVFVRPTNQMVIESVIKAEILETPGVYELTEFAIEIHKKNRQIEVLEAVATSTIDRAELEIVL